VKAFRGADEIVLASLFHPERYTKETAIDIPEMISAWQSSGKTASYRKDADAIVTDLGPRLTKGDVVLIMSNGGFGGIHQKLLDALEPK
jgi:UDP-N-acetylmuramate: L-alanyl-gamma-D-glutamyl-meso-diaminopimelate ligase